MTDTTEGVASGPGVDLARRDRHHWDRFRHLAGAGQAPVSGPSEQDDLFATLAWGLVFLLGIVLAVIVVLAAWPS